MRPSCQLLPLLLLASVLTSCKPGDREPLLFKSDERYLPMVGKPSPPLKFTALDGREVDLEKLRGKVVLLDFWATWCPPCLEEIPNVRRAYEQFSRDDFEIIGISFDVDRLRLEEVVKREQMPWPQYFDSGGRDAAPGKTFGIRHWPSMWLLDRNGVIRYISAGSGLEDKIATLIKQNANPVTSAKGVFEKKAALDQSGDEPTKPRAAVTPGGPISPPGAPQDAVYLQWLGKPFPALKFTAIDGRTVDTDKLRGKVLLIDFWATWCPPCMAEIPHVKAAYDRFNKQGFEVIGISADEARADLERVIRQKEMLWPQLFEGRSGETPNLRRYGIQHFPTMWLVDRQGTIRDVTGAVALEEKVARLLAEGSAPATTAPKANSPAVATTLPRTNPPAPAAAAAPVPRAGDITLGDQIVSVKNISIGAKRNTALLQIGANTRTIFPGADFVVAVGGKPQKVTCTEIDRAAVTLTVEGRAEPLRLALP